MPRITPLLRLPYLKALDYYQHADGSDYGLAVNRAIDAITASHNGRGEVVLPNRSEAYATPIAATSTVTIRGGGSATEMIRTVAATHASGVGTISATGSVGTRASLTTNATAGSGTIALPTGNGSLFSAGDLIELKSDAEVWPADAPSSPAKALDIRRVLAVSGDDVTIEGVLDWDFLTADSATFAKVTPKTGITIRDILITSDDPSTHYGYALQLELCDNIRVIDVTLRDAGGGVLLWDTVDSRVRGLTIDRIEPGWLSQEDKPYLGYGVALAGASAHIVVSDYFARNTRHAVTTLARTMSGPTYFGGPRDCTIADSRSIQTADRTDDPPNAHWDTHESGIRVRFDNVVAEGGGASGFQLRCPDATLTNCASFRVAGHGVTTSAYATNLRIEGGEFSYNGRSGVNLLVDNATVTGADIHHNDQYGVVFGSGIDAPYIHGCHIHDNGQEGGTYAGIGDAGATNARVSSNVIPFLSGKQTKAVEGVGATGVIVGNVCMGYGANDPFSGADVETRIERNATDRNGLTSANTSTTYPNQGYTMLVASGSGTTITLPSATTRRTVTIKRDDASNAITVARAGSDNIEGATSKSLDSDFAYLTLQANGGNRWYIIASGGTVA